MSTPFRRSFITLIALLLLLAACAAPGSPDADPTLEREVALQSTIQALEVALDAAPASEGAAPMPFEGFWVSENDDLEKNGQILVITGDHFYRLQTYDPAAPNLPVQSREMFAEILSVDQDAGHMVIRIKWVRANGQFGGFGHTTGRVTYSVDGEVLRMAMLQINETQFPDAPDPEPYYRK